MGVLVDLRSGHRIVLACRVLLGRHRACDVRIDAPSISGEHAALHWKEGRWELRDLGSTNGTLVNGAPLRPGIRMPLAPGTMFSLGGVEHAFLLEDAAEPSARARPSKGSPRHAVSGLLILPRDEEPLVSVFENKYGQWTAETSDASWPVADGDTIEAGGQTWVLDLPEPLSVTSQMSAPGPSIESIALRLKVSRDEEDVEVIVRHEESEMRLPPRSHQYLLVVLARALLSDRDASREERGWIDREGICQELGLSGPNPLYVAIFRTRQQFGELGVQRASDIILRRPSSGRFRLGTDRVEVVSL